MVEVILLIRDRRIDDFEEKAILQALEFLKVCRETRSVRGSRKLELLLFQERVDKFYGGNVKIWHAPRKAA